MLNGHYVLKKNKKVVRFLHWDGTKAHIVYLLQDQKIDIVPDLKVLNNESVPYKDLASISKAEVKDGPILLSEDITLEYIDNVENIDRSQPLVSDDNNLFKRVMKWSFMTHLIVLLLLISVGYYLTPDVVDVVQVVTVVKQDRPVIKKKKRVVRPSRKRVKRVSRSKRKLVTRKKLNPRSRVRVKVRNNSLRKKMSYVKRRSKSIKSRSKNVNAMGALGALGSMGSGPKGVSTKSIERASGHGRSSKSGVGVSQRSLLGKGLLSTTQGQGARVGQSRKGYGNNGLGAQGASGFGKHKISTGSGGAFVLPAYEQSIVEGGLDRASIDAVIRRNSGQITYCYEKGLQIKPLLSGRISVKFLINTKGRVSTARIASSSLHSSLVEKCIVKKFKSWQFPQPVGNVVVKVRYPLELRRSGRG